MAEEGSEGLRTENGGRMSSMDSVESRRWVFQDEDDEYEAEDEDDDDDSTPRMEVDSDDDDNAEQRLVRTGPRIDSFDVEALEVPGAHRNDYEVL